MTDENPWPEIVAHWRRADENRRLWNWMRDHPRDSRTRTVRVLAFIAEYLFFNVWFLTLLTMAHLLETGGQEYILPTAFYMFAQAPALLSAWYQSRHGNVFA